MTLSQASVFTRKAVVIFIGLIIFGLTLKVLFNIGYGIYSRCCIKIPQVQPDYKFGTIMGPTFPQGDTSTSSYSYTIDTTTGDLPRDLPTNIKVYFIPPTPVTLLSADRAKKLAMQLNFPNGPQKVSDTQQQFTDDKGGTLTIDLTNNNFTYQRVPTGDPSNNLPQAQDGIDKLESYLGSESLMHDDLKKGRTNVVYDGPSLNESNTVTVSIWPDDLDNLNIVTPDFSSGLIKGTISKYPAVQFIRFSYYYWNVDTSTYALYPLKSVDQAFADLKSGNDSYVAQKPDTNQVSITSVGLAYYESSDQGSYLYPVYVFQGPKYAAYVQAIINTPPTPTPAK